MKGWEEELWQCAKASRITKLHRVIEGGISAIDSTWKGICALKEEAGIDDLVVIHDAVRPLVSREIISGCLTIASQKGNAITVCPCYEEIFLSADGMSSAEGYLDRRHCFTSQSPHAARLGDIACQISTAKERGLPEPHYYSTLLSDLGVEIFLNKGSRLNFKITTQEAPVLFESILGLR